MTKVTSSDMERYRQSILGSLPSISCKLLGCCTATCNSLNTDMDTVCDQFLSSLSTSADLYLPKRSNRRKVVPGWNDSVKPFKEAAVFWNVLWVQADCLSSGILFDLRKRTKNENKYAVRRVKCQRNHIIRRKTAPALQRKNKTSFWKQVKSVKSFSSCGASQCPVVDGLTYDHNFSELFRSKLSNLLNCPGDISDQESVFNDLNHSITGDDIASISISHKMVQESLKKLGRDKSDESSLSSNHFILAAPVISNFLSDFFTLILRHGYIMPNAL